MNQNMSITSPYFFLKIGNRSQITKFFIRKTGIETYSFSTPIGFFISFHLLQISIGLRFPTEDTQVSPSSRSNFTTFNLCGMGESVTLMDFISPVCAGIYNLTPLTSTRPDCFADFIRSRFDSPILTKTQKPECFASRLCVLCAGWGNRTPVSSLGRTCHTTKLIPRIFKALLFIVESSNSLFIFIKLKFVFVCFIREIDCLVTPVFELRYRFKWISKNFFRAIGEPKFFFCW